MPAAIVAALIGAIAVWGGIRACATRALTRTGQPIRVGLVQGNVDQAQKWDVSRSVAIFGTT